VQSDEGDGKLAKSTPGRGWGSAGARERSTERTRTYAMEMAGKPLCAPQEDRDPSARHDA